MFCRENRCFGPNNPIFHDIRRGSFVGSEGEGANHKGNVEKGFIFQSQIPKQSSLFCHTTITCGLVGGGGGCKATQNHRNSLILKMRRENYYKNRLIENW